MSLIVTATDCVRCGFCPSGIKAWCDAHGIDVRAFLRHGIDAGHVTHLGDEMGLRAVAEAQRRVEHGRGR